VSEPDTADIVIDEEDLAMGERVCLEKLRPPLVWLRLGPVRREHIERLERLKGDWPPILVNRWDWSIIDGYYRYLAAQRLGYTHISCGFFEGDADDVYLEALRRKAHQGLPLTMRERELAADCLLNSHFQWSDRRIAELCGLPLASVGRVRAECPTVQCAPLDWRGDQNERKDIIDLLPILCRVREAIQNVRTRSLRRIRQATRL
jgi:hypothetical protein